jgi:beta-lactamase superfamily II metal-dependent hydrolase
MKPAVTVRMYNVGFGDAFLITIPDGSKHHTILMDCGSISKAEKGDAIGDVAQKMVDAVTTGGKARIDVVVATHRHKDHVAGFANGDIWKDVEVGEVWLPWTENPKDPEATRIRERQLKLTDALHRALAARPADDATLQAVLNAAGNEEAMDTLHRGFSGSPERRFIPKKGERQIDTDILGKKVKIHVLGPSRVESVIRDIDPPKAESYLRLGAARGNGAPAGETAPFGPQWRLKPEEFKRDEWSHLALDPATVEAIDNAGDLMSPELAAPLDKAINGRSLVRVVEIGSACLLFPGDAQWGTWDAILQDQEWNDLLKRATFLKVGHHGSHNATPISFVEKLLPRDLWAMVSTRPVKQWPNIPRGPLLTAISKRTAKLARSDKEADAPTPAFSVKGDYIEARIPIA